MPGRGQANIGTWPKSSVSSRGLGITWIAKATIGTFCSDFVVRKCLHSLFAVTLFFPFSEENINQNGAFFLCSHVTRLVHKNPALRNLHPVAYPASGHSGHALCLWLWGSIQCAKCGGMTAFDGNVNQHAANMSPRNLAVELCMQKKAP